MPQMSPMNWLLISIIFIMIMTIVKMMMKYYKMNSIKNMIYLKQKNMMWKW